MITLRRGTNVCGVELQHPAADMPNAWIVWCGCGDECVATLDQIGRAIANKIKLVCENCDYDDGVDEIQIRHYRRINQ